MGSENTYVIFSVVKIKVKNHINALVNLFYIQGILNNLIIDKGLNYLGKKNDLYESKNERFF